MPEVTSGRKNILLRAVFAVPKKREKVTKVTPIKKGENREKTAKEQGEIAQIAQPKKKSE